VDAEDGRGRRESHLVDAELLRDRAGRGGRRGARADLRFGRDLEARNERAVDRGDPAGRVEADDQLGVEDRQAL
jgi:hypothetical protein